MMSIMVQQDQMVKVRLRGPHAGDVETLWATPVDGDHYRLENSPFFAYGVSWEDVVEAHPGDDNVLEFTRRVERSGNRTLRVIFDYPSDDPRAEGILRRLREFRCSYEGMKPRMITINVPSWVDLDEVTDFLSGRSGLQWEYGDPTYEEVTGGRSA